MAQHGATKYERSQINAKFSSDKEQYEFAKKSYDRLNNMFKDSLISQQKYDEMLKFMNELISRPLIKSDDILQS